MDAVLRAGPAAGAADEGHDAVDAVDASGPVRDLDLDAQRSSRTGEPEVVLAEGKTAGQVQRAVRGLLEAGVAPVLATRCSPSQAAAVPEADYDGAARLLVARPILSAPQLGQVAVVTAGTSDLGVATECLAVLRAFGIAVELVADAGVAGVHRVLAAAPALREASVVVAVAGMEASLPTVLAGLVAAPVVAVPTSVGYGASFSGLTALLGMLASCAPGISVVNIDNGFGAAIVARRILRASGA